ncbi:DUF4998 domain-containing protein [Niabella sp. CC-SYL272]|uniref:DUF4998 domain-containing protein n=1 Tax=Niabella agricola TaxID=2891571 RepID=UPI001F284993|nr:DUF4998 domain-containing protein [Niabella agricola]MCF3108181.1 DUF4998 domain-containing protein [Niabella agricola]
MMNLYKSLSPGKWKRPGMLNGWIMALMLGCILSSCHKSMYDVSEEFYYRPEGIYLGVADSVKAVPGYNRVKLTWQVKADPRITQTLIYWNQRKDSVVVNITRTQNERIPAEFILGNLKEGDYIFELLTQNGTGLRSLPKQVSASVYGDIYIGNLRNRVIASIAKQPNGNMLIVWNPIASASILYTTVTYDSGGALQAVRVENADTQTLLQGLQSGGNIQVTTSFLPAGALDTLTASAQTYKLP